METKSSAKLSGKQSKTDLSYHSLVPSAISIEQSESA